MVDGCAHALPDSKVARQMKNTGTDILQDLVKFAFWFYLLAVRYQ